MISRRRLLGLTGGGLGFGALGGYAFAIEPRFRLVIRHWHVRHPHWPRSAKPLRMTCLADLHAVEPWMPASRIRSIVEAALSLRPDIIVLLGDYVEGLTRFRSALVPVADWSRALSGLSAPLGVYAVLGNHDWWFGADAVRAGLRAGGVRILENEAVPLELSGQPFWLAGLADQLAFPAPGGMYRGADDLPATLAGIGNDAPVILLAHEPDIFPKVPGRVMLTLCGHTHGGQVYLPFIGRPVVPSAYGQRYAYGHIVEQGRHLVVSAGLGLSVLPVRFLVPPEITVVTVMARIGAE